MAVLLVVLSGPVCAGKTTLADGLAHRCGARVLATRALIADRSGASPEEQLSRARLQVLGRQLDASSGGQWVSHAVRALATQCRPTVVDSVRTPEQVHAVRSVSPTLHVHLTAPQDVLEQRYAARAAEHTSLGLATYSTLQDDATERAIERLSPSADVLVDTGQLDAAATLERVLTALA